MNHISTYETVLHKSICQYIEKYIRILKTFVEMSNHIAQHVPVSTGETVLHVMKSCVAIGNHIDDDELIFQNSRPTKDVKAYLILGPIHHGATTTTTLLSINKLYVEI